MIVGYVGTPLMYNCSVFGAPVALAARCAGVKPDLPGESEYGLPTYGFYMTFPAAEWGERDLNEVFPPRTYEDMEGRVRELELSWELLPSRFEEVRNIGQLEIRQLVDRGTYWPEQAAEERAIAAIRGLHEEGRYWPRDA